jgi:transposase-like protein
MASGNIPEFQMFKGRHFDRSVILLCVRWYLGTEQDLCLLIR